MKNVKQWLSVILSIVVVFTMALTPAMAAGTDNGSAATITVETVQKEVKAGDEVTLNVSIANNPGFVAYDFLIDYDKADLELKEVANGSFKGNLVGNEKTAKVNFFAEPNAGEHTNDGVLFTLTFNVKADCADGAQVTLETTTFKNAKNVKLNPTIVAGGINVTTGGSTTGGSTTGGSTTGGSTTGGSTTGGSTTGGSTTGGSTTGGTTGGDPIPDYKVIEGANSTWTENSNGTVTVRSNGDFAKFTGIEMDGIAVARENYDAKSGSTIVTLHKDYLATLSVGTHALTFVFTDGTCSTGLTIKSTGSSVEVTVPSGNTTTPGNASNPGTGANDTVGVAAALAVFAVASCIAISRKK